MLNYWSHYDTINFKTFVYIRRCGQIRKTPKTNYKIQEYL